MTVPQFKKWLEMKRRWLAYVADYYEDTPTFVKLCASDIAAEASQHVAELHLHELMRQWGEQAEVLEVDKYLVECLGSLPDTKTLFTPPEIAEQLAVAPETVVGWIKSGQLKGSNLATAARPRYVVQPDDLSSFLKSRQPEPPQPRKPKAKKSGYRRFSE